MNTDKLKTCALLNKGPGRGITMAASGLFELGIRPPPRILALAFGTLLAVAPASNVIAQNLKQIGILVIEGVTPQPVPVFSAGVQYINTLGKAQFSVFTLTKRVDATSPILLVNTASGRHIPEASIDLFGPPGTTVFTRYELTNVVVMGASVGSVEDGKRHFLVEDVSLDYAKIKQTVFTPSGPVEGCWDKEKNITC